MTSNNKTVSCQMPWAGNVAKTMTWNGKQFTVTRQSWPLLHFLCQWSDYLFCTTLTRLFCYITNHLMNGPLGNSAIIDILLRNSRRFTVVRRGCHSTVQNNSTKQHKRNVQWELRSHWYLSLQWKTRFPAKNYFTNSHYAYHMSGFRNTVLKKFQLV